MKLSLNSRWLYFFASCVLAIITILVYLPSLHYPFQFDDLGSIIQHFQIRNHTLRELFFSGTRWISYWLNALHYSIGGFDPFSYRVGNLIIHTGNGLLVFFITLLGCGGLSTASWFHKNSFYLAFTTSLLFLLHPVQSQTVLYVIQGQLEGLAALTILSMVLCLILFVRAPSALSKTICATLLCIFAALSTGTKEIAIISPVALLIVDYFFLSPHQGGGDKSRRSSRSEGGLFSRWWLYVLVGTIVVGCYLYFLKPAFFFEIFSLNKVIRNNIGNVVTTDPKAMIGPWIYFISQFKAIVHYLWMFIWPFNISVEYDDVLCRSFCALDCLAPLALLVTIASVAIKLLRSKTLQPLAFGIIWFFACIAPRSTFIPSNELIVDYKTYTASFGWLFVLAVGLVSLCLVLVRGIQKIAPRIPLSLVYGIFTLIVIIALMSATIKRSRVWHSGLEFWENILHNAPAKARVQNNYGVELSKLDDHKESIRYFKKAIDLDKNYADPYANLAIACTKLNRLDDAIKILLYALRINPYVHESYNTLGNLYIQKKEYATAERMLQAALKINPHYGEAYGNLARMYLEQKRPDIAWGYLKKGCTEADLDTPVGFNAFAVISLELKKYDDAIWGFKKALALNPAMPNARLNLANAYFLSHQCASAETLYLQLLNGSAQDAFMYYNLGKAASEQGKFAKAVEYFSHIPRNHPQIKDASELIAACHKKIFA